MNNPKYKTAMPNSMFALAGILKEAVWYYLWCTDRTTEEITYDEDGATVFGSVFGGMPCSDSFVAQDLPNISKWTIKRWRESCFDAGVIRTKRTPVGYSIQVVNSTKFSADKRKHAQKWGNSKPHERAQMPTLNEQICQLAPQSELVNQQLRIGESPTHSQSELVNQQLYIEKTVFKKENREQTGVGMEGRLEGDPATPLVSENEETHGQGKDLSLTDLNELLGRMTDSYATRTKKSLSATKDEKRRLAELVKSFGPLTAYSERYVVTGFNKPWERIGTLFDIWVKRKGTFKGLKKPVSVFLEQYHEVLPEHGQWEMEECVELVSQCDPEYLLSLAEEGLYTPTAGRLSMREENYDHY